MGRECSYIMALNGDEMPSTSTGLASGCFRIGAKQDGAFRK